MHGEGGKSLMSNQIPVPGKHVVIAKEALQHIFTALRAANYTVVGPTIQEEAIVYDELTDINDLPVGWQDIQNPGTYRLEHQDDARYFDYGRSSRWSTSKGSR